MSHSFFIHFLSVNRCDQLFKNDLAKETNRCISLTFVMKPSETRTDPKPGLLILN